MNTQSNTAQIPGCTKETINHLNKRFAMLSVSYGALIVDFDYDPNSDGIPTGLKLVQRDAQALADFAKALIEGGRHD